MELLFTLTLLVNLPLVLTAKVLSQNVLGEFDEDGFRCAEQSIFGRTIAIALPSGEDGQCALPRADLLSD